MLCSKPTACYNWADYPTNKKDLMEIFGVPLHILLLAELVAFVAALVKGSTGFGFGLLAIPLLVLMLDAKLVVAIAVPIQIVIDALILSRVWQHIEIKKVAPIVLAGAVGIPLGTFIILTISSDTLRLFVLSVVMVSSLLMITGYTVRISRERLASAITGLAAGALYSSTGISGPPMVLFMLNQKWSRETFRSTLSVASICLETLTVISFAASGVINARSLGLDLVLLPVVLFSFYLATKLLARINPTIFRKLAIYLVLIAGIVGVATHFLR